MALDAISLAAVTSIGLSGLPGSRLGHYRLLERIGAGAYAAVYRAIYEVMGVGRAVKVLRPQAASLPGQPAQFLREARVAARLRHPNVVAVYDCGTAANDVYALTVVLYEMLTGRTPDGVGAAGASNGPQHDPPPPRAVNPYLPEAVDGSLAAGLSRDPCRRPTSAGGLVAQLAAALGQPALAANDAAARPCAAVGREADRLTSLPPLPREAPPPSMREVPPSLARRFAALIGAGQSRQP